MSTKLPRVVGLPGAVLLGLGSILGTGVFVSIGIAADVAGPAVVLAVVLAAGVAACNGLSSAQLAASHPVSGGTYEYGYRYLAPSLGFVAGWMFLSAKSASAATAALGFSGYVLNGLGVSGDHWRVVVALAGVAGFTLLVAGGMTRSNRANAAIVTVTVVALAAFVLAGSVTTGSVGEASLPNVGDWRAVLHATALMFVAYTGYGRIATLGEEVHRPEQTIPRAIVITLGVTLLLYVGVAVIGVKTLGAEGLAAATARTGAPLEVAARTLGVPRFEWLIAAGAVTAMLGVLLNLLLGLSRVLLAMARRGDMPRGLAAVDANGRTPRNAVYAVGVLVAGLTLTGDVRVTWSFSAFTVLVYYAITNVAALRLPDHWRRYPRPIALAGLLSCLGLAFFIEAGIWVAGLALIGLGLAWHAVARRQRSDA